MCKPPVGLGAKRTLTFLSISCKDKGEGTRSKKQEVRNRTFQFIPILILRLAPCGLFLIYVPCTFYEILCQDTMVGEKTLSFLYMEYKNKKERGLSQFL